MPSPFPGMDPYLEDQDWEDFHTRFNVALSDALLRTIRPRYVVRVERRVYVERGLDSEDQIRRAEFALLSSGFKVASAPAAQADGALAPVECLLPEPQERQETFLVVRELPGLEVVTIIETLSPANKRSSSDGREQYLAKRREILASRTNLVELDLLRGGKRLPVIGMPAGDYFAIVSRGNRRPRTHVYAWQLPQRLPTIPIPLKPDEPEPAVDLQAVFAEVYDRVEYQLTLNYSADLDPPLSAAEIAWKNEQLQKRS